MTSRPTKFLIALAVVLAVALIALATTVVVVPSGYTGLLTTHGKIDDEAMPSGLHFKLPWQKVVKLNNRIQTLRIAAGTDNADISDAAETKDQQLIPVFEFEIQYQLNADMSHFIYSNYGRDYADTLLRSNALQFIKETFASYEADTIVSAKAEIPAQILKRLSEVTSPLGVNIVRVNLVTYEFSAEYTALLEERAMLAAQLENNQIKQRNETIAAQTQYDVAVKQAEKDAETQRISAENQNAIVLKEAEAQAEVARIQADNDAYVTRTKAEAERDARLASAEAEKAEIEAKASALNEYVIQQDFIEKWDGKLMPSFGDTGIGFTNYTDIIESYLPNAGE